VKALISVSDKNNLDKLLASLKKHGYEFISTGGTAKYIRELGFEVQEVSDLTNFPEILGGRVKTLHPKIFGGILADIENPEHLLNLKNNYIEKIDLLVVNLYPFEDFISRDDCTLADAVEYIDIGGVALLRSAAKNYKSVTAISSIDQYEELIDELEKNKSTSSMRFREKMAVKVFKDLLAYDTVISKFLDSRLNPKASQDSFPNLNLDKEIKLTLKKQKDLRYGENPHQKAAVYVELNTDEDCIALSKQIQGKELSYNNILDLEAAWNIVSEYERKIPCVSIIKHNNPCGVAISPSVAQAFSEALACDTVSAFGGVLASNNIIDLAAANEMTQLFLEAIVAPGFTEDALKIFSIKTNLRLIEHPFKGPDLLKSHTELEVKKLSNSYLIQEKDLQILDKEKMEVLTETKVDENLWVDLLLAWKVVKHCKSNAIVAALNGRTVGIGVGQTNRVKAVEDALRNIDFDSKGAVLASDGFFPFADSIHLAAQNNISAIIQPGGSIRDPEVIEACNQAGIAMVMTHIRHFKH
jgi:phosphoribosylaminoimidazolecarboxamide formyltransferase / IMP cyclohydrolase